MFYPYYFLGWVLQHLVYTGTHTFVSHTSVIRRDLTSTLPRPNLGSSRWRNNKGVQSRGGPWSQRSRFRFLLFLPPKGLLVYSRSQREWTLDYDNRVPVGMITGSETPTSPLLSKGPTKSRSGTAGVVRTDTLVVSGSGDTPLTGKGPNQTTLESTVRQAHDEIVTEKTPMSCRSFHSRRITYTWSLVHTHTPNKKKNYISEIF